MIKYTFTSKGAAGFPQDLVNYHAIRDYICDEDLDEDAGLINKMMSCVSTILDDKGNAKGLMILSKESILASTVARYISGLLISNTLSFRCDMEYMQELVAS